MAQNSTMDWLYNQTDQAPTASQFIPYENSLFSDNYNPNAGPSGYDPQIIKDYIQGTYGIPESGTYSAAQANNIYNYAAKHGFIASQLDNAMAGTGAWVQGTAQNYIDSAGLANLAGKVNDAGVNQTIDSSPGYSLQPTLDYFDKNLQNAAVNSLDSGNAAIGRLDSYGYKPKTTTGYIDTLAGVLDQNSPVLNQLAYNAGADASARGFGRSTVASGIANRTMLEGASKLAASEVDSQQFNVGEINKQLSEMFGAKVNMDTVTLNQLNSLYSETMKAGNTAQAQKIADIMTFKQNELDRKNKIETTDITANASKYGADKGLKGNVVRADASKYGSDKGLEGNVVRADASKYGAGKGLEGDIARANATSTQTEAQLLQQQAGFNNNKDVNAINFVKDLTAGYDQYFNDTSSSGLSDLNKFKNIDNAGLQYNQSITKIAGIMYPGTTQAELEAAGLYVKTDYVDNYNAENAVADNTTSTTNNAYTGSSKSTTDWLNSKNNKQY